MEGFHEFFYVGFHATVTFLKAKEHRKWLQSTIFADENSKHFSWLFTSFDATLVDHRWGYLVECCDALASRECALLLCWDGARLRQAVKKQDASKAAA